MRITTKDLKLAGMRIRKDGTAERVEQTAPIKKHERIEGVYRSKLERDYARHLDMLKAGGEVQSYHYEAIKVRYTRKNFYEPDFKVVYANGHVEIVEMKGHVREDDKIKCNAAAAILWPWKVVMIRQINGRWVRTEF